MNQKTYRLPNIDDMELLDIIKNYRDAFGVEHNAVNATVGLATGVSIDLEGDISSYAGRYTIESTSIGFSISSNISISLSLSRNVIEAGVIYPVKCVWSISNNQGRALTEFASKFGEVSNLLNSHVEVQMPSNAGLTSDGFRTAIQALTSQHQSMLHSLDQKVNDLDAKRDKLVGDLEAERAKQLDEHNRDMDALAAQRRKLQLESPRAERRKILSEFTAAAGHLADDVNLGTPYIYIRVAIFLAAMTSGVIFAILAFSSILSISGGSIGFLGFNLVVAAGEGLSSNLSMLGFLAFKSAISTAISIGSFLLGVNWLRSFQTEELQNARSVSRFKRDLIRASWIIETVQEIKGEHGTGEVPEVWLQRATQGMFEKESSSGADAESNGLRSILKNSTKLSIGPNGMDVTVDKKGARNLADEV